MKACADDATLISTSKEIHTTVLSEADSKARVIGLLLKLSRCVSLLCDGSKFLSNGISLIGGTTKSIVGLRPEYKVWIYRNYILSIIRFHLTIDCIGPSTITKMENLATKYLKRWLRLPRSATRVILYYPGVCSLSISLTVKNCKLSLLANVSQ